MNRRTDEELRAALRRQIGHLRRSMRSYDEGAVEEGERLASCAYILLYDNGRNAHSLLGQLKLLEQIKFPDSRALMSSAGTGLATPIEHNGEIEFVPNFMKPHPLRTLADCPLLPFDDWWSQPVFFTRRRDGTRSKLVRALRDTDGGGHIDPALKDRDYVRLTTHGVPGLSVKDGQVQRTLRIHHGGGPKDLLPEPAYGPPALYAHWASMRQMALEIETAIGMLVF